MIARRYIVALLLIALALPAAVTDASAQTASVRVEPVAAGQTLAEPGNVTTIAYRITTASSGSRSVHPSVQLPPGWILVGRPERITFFGSEIAFVSFRAPRQTPAGSYEIQITVRDDTDPNVAATAIAPVEVTSAAGIDLSVPAPTAFVRAGEMVFIPLTVTNLGNAAVQVQLQVNTTAETARLDSSVIRLGASRSRVVQISLATESQLTREAVYDVYVRGTTGGTRPAVASASTRVRVLPQYGQSGSERTTEPVLVSLQTVGNESGSAGRVGATGSMAAFGGTVDLDLLVANRQQVSIFGRRDQFRLAFVSDALTVRFGDQVQRLTPLTTTGEYGAGMGVQFTDGTYTFRGFAQRTRYGFPTQSVAGASVGYRPSRLFEGSLNALRREGDYRGTVFSARGLLTPIGPKHVVDLECGLDSGNAYEQPSCSAELTGATSALNYQGRVVNTSDSFPGPQGRANEKSLRLSYRITDPFTIDGAVRTHERSLLSDFGQRTTLYRAGVAWTSRLGPFRTFTRTQYLTRSWIYSAPTQSVDRTEEILMLQLGLHSRPLDLTGSVEWGNTFSRSNDYRGPSRRYQLMARVEPISWFSVSATGESAHGYLYGSTRPIRWSMINLRTAVQAGRRTDISAAVFRNVIESNYRQPYTSLQAQAQHTLSNGHVLSLQIQHSLLSGDRPIRSTDYRLAYALPVGLPIRRLGATDDILTGRVYDAESGIGLPGILMYLGGHASISDERGRFEIPSPAHDGEYLTLDQQSMGYGVVSMIPMPLEIQKSETSLLEIPVVRAGTVRGDVSRFGSPTGQRLLGERNTGLARQSGVGNVILGLKSGSIEHRARTSPSGAFEFRNVIPGTYTARIVTAPRLSYHRFEPDSVQVQIGAGEQAEIAFRAVPVIPEIKMVSMPVRTATPIASISVRSSSRESADGADLWTNALAAGRRYTLIVGSTLDPAFAHHALDRFEGLGMPRIVLTHTGAASTRYRMAVGQFASAKEADQMRSQLADRIPSGTWVLRYREDDLVAPAATSVKWEGGASYRYTLVALSSLSRKDAEAAEPKYRAVGLPVKIVESDEPGGRRYRLALGQFATSAEADRMRGVRAAELPSDVWVYRYRNASLRTLAPRGEDAWNPNTVHRYTLVVLSSLSESFAEAQVKRYRRLGLPIDVISANVAGRTRYRLVVGQYLSAHAADEARATLSAHLPLGTWVFRFK